MEEQEKVVIDKAPQVAYCSLRKLHCKPFVDNFGRVKFEVSGPVMEILSELQNNPKVPLLDFLNRLDAVRSIIFTLKGRKNGEGIQR